MKSTLRDIEDIVDLVEQEVGWRVAQTSHGWRIFPPDKSLEVIQVSYSGDLHAAENLRARLRRANFAPLLRTKKPLPSTRVEPMPTTAAPPATKTPPAVEPRNLIREARSKIQDALEALSSIDTLLGEIDGERDQVQRFKELVASMLK